ncbi:MAG: TonB-dependent receptor, partial [Bacteroidota bacterium]|nr:TonB-dependent receptor [Bacteroidota bacterium]
PFNQHELSLSYDYENKRVTYSVELSLQYAKKPIAPVFIQASDYILQTEANIDNLKTYSTSMFFQWYLFENNLVRLRWYSELFRTDNKYNNFNWGHTDYRIIPSILVDYKKWDLEIFYQSSTKVMTGQLLTEKSSMAKVELSYKPVKNLTTTLAIRYPFYDAWKTSTQTCDSCILKHLETERVKNDANMVYFNVVYYFSFGKLKKDIRKKLNNSDNDSGILNRS